MCAWSECGGISVACGYPLPYIACMAPGIIVCAIALWPCICICGCTPWPGIVVGIRLARLIGSTASSVGECGLDIAIGSRFAICGIGSVVEGSGPGVPCGCVDGYAGA